MGEGSGEDWIRGRPFLQTIRVYSEKTEDERDKNQQQRLKPSAYTVKKYRVLRLQGRSIFGLAIRRHRGLNDVRNIIQNCPSDYPPYNNLPPNAREVPRLLRVPADKKLLSPSLLRSVELMSEEENEQADYESLIRRLTARLSALIARGHEKEEASGY